MKGNKGFVNEFNLHEYTVNEIAESSPLVMGSMLNIGESAYHFNKLLTTHEVQLINDQIDEMSWVPGGKDGILSHYHEGDMIGSWRMTCYEPKLAEALWNRIKSGFP